MTETLAAPAGLAPRGTAFWATVASSYVLDAPELELLTEICRALDDVEDLHRAVAAEGRTVAGSRGQPRAHPALAELRATRVVLGRLLAQLELPDVDGESLPSPVQARGRRAARERWDHRGTA